MRAYLLTYDIADKKRLRKVHRLALAYGTPLQYSVFACLLRPVRRVELGNRIAETIDPASDRVVIIDLGAVRDRETWIPPLEAFGRQLLPEERNAIIV